MFVDASAIVAIITREAESDVLTDALDAVDVAITSPVAVFEAILGVRRKQRSSVIEAEKDVRDFLTAASVRSVSIAENETAAAVAAFARYGKGQGHPAQLNMGDCFAYAVAKTHGASLLFKGEDFSKTDIQSAVQTT